VSPDTEKEAVDELKLMEKRIKEIMSVVFETDLSMITDDASPETLDIWDSLKHMNLITALEEEFHVTFSDNEILEMLSYKLILTTIGKKLV
jgi:acyl carrier protein